MSKYRSKHQQRRCCEKGDHLDCDQDDISDDENTCNPYNRYQNITVHNLYNERIPYREYHNRYKIEDFKKKIDYLENEIKILKTREEKVITLYELYRKQLYTDYDLIINGKLYKLHSYVFSSSEFLQQKYQNRDKFDKDINIVIEDINNKMIKEYIIDAAIHYLYNKHIYGLDVMDTEENIEQLYTVSKFLLIHNLSSYLKSNYKFL